MVSSRHHKRWNQFTEHFSKEFWILLSHVCVTVMLETCIASDGHHLLNFQSPGVYHQSVAAIVTYALRTLRYLTVRLYFTSFQPETLLETWSGEVMISLVLRTGNILILRIIWRLLGGSRWCCWFTRAAVKPRNWKEMQFWNNHRDNGTFFTIASKRWG